MEKSTSLIVMLTYNDKTVANAAEIFDSCKDTSAQYWGFKEAPLPLDKMKELYNNMKRSGKKTALEVIAYDEEKCLEGAKMAVDCGVDMLMGTVFFDSVNELCKEHGIKYMPFVGEVYDRPSVLDGDIDKMIADANECIRKGAYGIDLLAYRYTGDASELLRRFVSEVDAPVCIAGSVDSTARLDEIKQASPRYFTIGSAFFDGDFGEGFDKQIDTVIDYMKEPAYV